MAATTVCPVSMLQHPGDGDHHFNSNNKKKTDVDKLTFEIFSILENKFLFGCDHPNKLQASSPLNALDGGKVRILSIDSAGSTDGVLAACSLAHLEATLQRKSGNPDARVSDFFDVVAGSGAGGVLAGLLFTRGRDGRPLFTAEEALGFVAAGRFSAQAPVGGILRRVFGAPADKKPMLLRKAFGEMTLRDTLKALLIPCYDLSTGAPFLFSRADALEMDGCDFKMADVCASTIAGTRALVIASTDGRKRMVAVGGGVAMSNPTAAAITHVLHNKQEFPFCKGVEDLVVVSLGNGEMDCAAGNHRATPLPAAFVSIAGDGAADMVDQAVSMAFRQCRTSNYVRIQANGIVGKKTTTLNIHHHNPTTTYSASSYNNNNHNSWEQRTTTSTSRNSSSTRSSSTSSSNKYEKKKNMMDIIGLADQMLAQKNVESVLFRGKKLVDATNLEKLELFGGELIKEQQWRMTSCLLPPVILKHHHHSSAPSPPRSSFATTLSTLSSSS